MSFASLLEDFKTKEVTAMSVESPPSKNVSKEDWNSSEDLEEDWPSSEDLEEWVRPFFNKFDGFAFEGHLGDLIYCHYNSKNKWFYCHPLEKSDVERLMKKSLEVGEDLLLKECKDRPYDWGPRLVDENGYAGSLSESDYAGEQASSILEGFEMDDEYNRWLHSYKKFRKLFGYICVDPNTPGPSKRAYLRYADNDETLLYDISYITGAKLKELFEKSAEDEVDYLYEAVKEYAYRYYPVLIPESFCYDEEKSK